MFHERPALPRGAMVGPVRLRLQHLVVVLGHGVEQQPNARRWILLLFYGLIFEIDFKLYSTWSSLLL